MKSYFWKFLICIVPCALAGWVAFEAISKYRRGEPGGFKLGVDLVGGTILVYEIDLRKNVDADSSGKSFDPARDINVLAESLKRRIDPNDLYNIVIRPAGEGRVEIILPTGGTHRIRKAEESWRELLQTMKDKWKLSDRDVEVGRGKVLELADRIQTALSEEKWKTTLFNNTEAWKRLIDHAVDIKSPDSFPELDTPTARAELNAISPGDIVKLAQVMLHNIQLEDVNASEKSVNQWIKKQAWNEMMEQAREKWPFLKPFKEDMERITPDSFEQLVMFIQARGNIIGASGLAVIEPIVGKQFLDNSKDAVPYAEVAKFIEDNYGPSLTEIQKSINEITEKTGRSRDLSIEEVQRIKDLVAKVGSLEFRILANSKDDKIGEDEAKKTIDEARDLEERAKKGQPPPPPPGVFEINLPRGYKSRVTYSWVELGPQERKQLNLDNAARNDTTRSGTWIEATKEMNKAIQLRYQDGKPMLQGALFLTRKCEDRNLPDEERRQKEYEYFVLTRDPEFVDATDTKRTPKIDGSYLVSAISSPGQDLRPAVHFTFNAAGGDLFGEITRKNVPSGTESGEDTQVRRHLAIILDALVMSAPTINSEIRTNGQISGSFTQKEVDSLVNILRAGRLPATLKPQPVSENTMGPTLGQDTIEAGVRAIGIAFIAILGFMIVYYRFAGLVASVALLANLVLTVGFMVLVQATFTLPGLAGLVLMLGMAVDANILIYERLREERERGANLAQAIRNGYDRALPTIIDTHLSSIFTAIVLYVVGNDQLKGFGVSLTVGLIISLFTSLYMTRVLFDFWLAKGWLTKLRMFRLFARPDIDFMGIRNVMFIATLTLAILGVALFIGRLPNDLNIDFVGGTAYGGQLNRALNIQELRELVEEPNQKNWLKGVKAKEVEGSGGYSYQLTYEKGEPKTVTVNVANLALPNPPAPSKPEDQAKYQDELHKVVAQRETIIAQRASELPDPSAEQIFINSDQEPDPAKTKRFNIRTSEKEPDLVQATLDRLLRDQSSGTPLMQKVFIKAGPFTNNREVMLLFFKEADFKNEATASPSFVKSLFNKELMRAFHVTDKNELPIAYELFGEGKAGEDGRHPIIRIRFESELKPDQLTKVEQALARTILDFEARPAPDRLENFDSQLATETRFRAMWAIILSWAAILIYLWFRFGNWTFGLAAVICLIHDLFFTLGAIAACHFLHGTFVGDLLAIEEFKIDLPAVAALLTLVGYSVNDTIVVFDRIREVRGKNPDLTPQMINDSVNQTLSRTILASLATWLVVFVLYVWGGPGVHLFAFVMVVGVIVGTYSSIYIASPLLLFLGEGTRSTQKTLESRLGIKPEGAGV